jgi:hypothetical protein
MILREAILKSLEYMKTLSNSAQVYDYIVSHNYYQFEQGRTPKSTISAQLGEFIRKNDTRVKRHLFILFNKI